MADAFILSEQQVPWFSGPLSVYYCRFSVSAYSDQLFADYRIVYPPTLNSAVAKRKAEFLAGRYCAKQSLVSFQCTDVDIPIGQYRDPLWPPQIVGSISHTNTDAIAVTALQTDFRGIGIDLEHEIDTETFAHVYQQIIFAEERDIILQTPQSLEQRQLLTLAFSAKESFFKAAFAEVNSYFDFSRLAISRIDMNNQMLMMHVTDSLSEGLVAGTEVTAEFRLLENNKVVTLVKLDPI